VTPEIARSFGLKELKGALVSDVSPGGPAASGGLKRGDIIVSFDGKEIKEMNDLPIIVAGTPVGKTVEVKILREGKEVPLKVTVAEMTAERTASQMPAMEESLGMTVDDIKPKWVKAFGLKDSAGVVVIDVAEGSPADDSGIQPGDIIKEINRKPVRNLKDYSADIRGFAKGKPVLLLIKRGSQSLFVSISAS
jgi:serine protease Do